MVIIAAAIKQLFFGECLLQGGNAFIRGSGSAKKRPCSGMSVIAQDFQKALTKEYTLNHIGVLSII